ncbi:uncharacterized protein DS421_12g373640 [Arachis hypogaea]|nr:uncharacterized protein DS421_12g373640 [Arachis hypogaea]
MSKISIITLCVLNELYFINYFKIHYLVSFIISNQFVLQMTLLSGSCLEKI